jgi:hypothetical protein
MFFSLADNRRGVFGMDGEGLGPCLLITRNNSVSAGRCQPFSAVFFARVEPVVRLFQVGDGDTDILLSGGQLAVAEKFLDMPNVGAVAERNR